MGSAVVEMDLRFQPKPVVRPYTLRHDPGCHPPKEGLPDSRRRVMLEDLIGPAGFEGTVFCQYAERLAGMQKKCKIPAC